MPNLKRVFDIPYNESKHNILALVGKANKNIDFFFGCNTFGHGHYQDQLTSPEPLFW
jgi:hypothetical protein